MRVRLSAVVLLLVVFTILLTSCQLGNTHPSPALGSSPPPPVPSSPPPPQSAAPMQVLYVLQDSKFVSTYQVNLSTGVPTLVGGPQALDEPSGAVLQLTPSPDDHFLYVQWSDAQKHGHLSVHPTNSAGVPQTSPAQRLEISGKFLVHPAGKSAYLLESWTDSQGNNVYDIRLFHIDRATGMLNEDPQVQASYAPDPAWTTDLYGFNPDGSTLYDARHVSFHGYTGDNYGTYDANASTGILGQRSDFFTDGASWGCCAQTAVIGRQFIVVDNLFGGPLASMAIYARTPNPGTPLFVCTSTMLMLCGAGPFPFYVDPSGQYVFLGDGTAGMHLVRINSATKQLEDTGGLIPVAGASSSFVVPKISFSANGKLVYSIGQDSEIEIYRLEPDSGTLTLGEGAPLNPALPFSIFLAERR